VVKLVDTKDLKDQGFTNYDFYKLKKIKNKPILHMKSSDIQILKFEIKQSYVSRYS